ncbi:MAG: pyridoxamine 5'-phosphate oxidase family protein, partial [Candidatus Omnitrophota bacterium]
MDLKEYFEKKNGFGVLSTADENGKVDAAPYARPHVVDDTHIAFIMSDRLSHANIRKNPYAVYLFKEGWFGYRGKRLYLKKER